MYTYISLAVFFLILSGIIFGKNIKQNQLNVIFIVFLGTLIGSCIVNGIVGLKTPCTLTHVKTKEFSKQPSKVYTLQDTLFQEEYTHVQYIYGEKIKRNGDTVVTNYVDIGGSYDGFYSDGNKKIDITFLSEGDTIPRVEIYKYKRHVDSKWVSSFGLPGGERIFHVYIPKDSIHNILMDQLNEKFFKNETEEIAQLD